MDAKKVGKKIAQLRKENNMTQKELASKLNVIDKTVSRWECGYGLPDLAIIPEIAAIFNTSIEELLGTNADGTEISEIVEVKEPQEECPDSIDECENGQAEAGARVDRVFKNKKWFVPVGLALAVCLCVVIAILSSLKPNEERIIKGYCWEVADQSEADYVFITAFGMEECMSLELWGDEAGGEFFCQETWRSGTSETPVSCAIYGEYIITEGKIHFLSTDVIDEQLTNKLRLHTSLGIESFVADIEYSEDNKIDKIVFKSTVKNSESSVFGRWTKYGNYFSREKGEVCFERVQDEISYEQLLKMPTFVAVNMGMVVPYKLEVYLDRYNYYVGEIISFEDLRVSLVYSDGTRESVEDVVCEQLGRELSTTDECLTVVHTAEEMKTTAIVYINVEYGYVWDRVQNSEADFKYFTHYNTGDSISFGLLELFGNDKKGEFVYSENYGVGTLSDSAVVKGKYKIVNGEIHFVSLAVFTSRNYLPKFYLNSEGDYFTAYPEEKLSGISFHTGQLERNMFGHYTTEQKETSFSQATGVIYFEAVDGNSLSERAVNVLEYYKSMYK